MGKLSLWYATIRGALPGREFVVALEPPDALTVHSRYTHRSVVLRLEDIDGRPPASVVDLLRTALGAGRVVEAPTRDAGTRH